MKNEITIDGVVYVKKEPTHVGAYGIAITPEEPKPWPQVGDEYHTLTYNGVARCTYENDNIDKKVLDRGNAHRLREDAKLADQARIAVTKIKNYAKEQWGEFVPDWDSSERKYSIAWNYEIGKPDVDYSNFWCKFSPIGYFREREHAEEIITKFPEELEVIRKFYT